MTRPNPDDPRWEDECTCGHRRRTHATVRGVEVACVFCDCRLFVDPNAGCANPECWGC